MRFESSFSASVPGQMREASEYATGNSAPTSTPTTTPGAARGASRAPAMAAANTTR